nr:hypothetical protein Iba_chr14fCG12330 [Ipomoea batatas]
MLPLPSVHHHFVTDISNGAITITIVIPAISNCGITITIISLLSLMLQKVLNGRVNLLALTHRELQIPPVCAAPPPLSGTLSDFAASGDSATFIASRAERHPHRRRQVLGRPGLSQTLRAEDEVAPGLDCTGLSPHLQLRVEILGMLCINRCKNGLTVPATDLDDMNVFALNLDRPKSQT